MKILIYFLTALFSVISLPSAYAADLTECPGQHCSQIANQINETCKQLGGAGSLMFVEYPPGSTQYCYCKCSCVAADTPVEIGPNRFKQMGQLKVGEPIMVLENGAWKPSKIVFSDGTQDPKKPFPYAIFVGTANGSSVITTPDHVFLLGDGSLKRADRLSPSDKLTDAKSLTPTAITTLHSGSYFGPIHNVVATEWNEKETKSGHLINTAGVVSGDYLSQVYLPSEDAAPQVGTSTYRKKYAVELASINKMVSAPTVAALRSRNNKISSATPGGPLSIVLNEKKGWKFVAHAPIATPKDAHNFLPDSEASAAPGMLYPLDYTVPYDVAVYVTEHFKRFYPDVTYLVDWTSDEVNAKAYIQNGRRHVLLLGGLIRHKAISVEGIELVTAHELGHHYGGKPTYSGSWASCEGQSDYWGAKIAMRNVWWGQEALIHTQKGAEQVYKLFSSGLLMGNLIERDTAKVFPAAGICSHPPAQCRLNTYQAAIRLDGKPSCAGDPN